ncbi:MAG: hypothetical protein RLZZ200_704 [Pseudomonadota bacterium]
MIEKHWSRARTFLAGASSASVVLLAFLIPSLQDQWDRHETRIAVDRYVAVGDRLLQESHYASAEQSYNRAVELAGYQRYDLIEKQIRARVMRVYEDPAWHGKTPDEVTEADYIYLLEVQRAPAQSKDRAATLAAYGVYLAGLNRLQDAESRLKEAVQRDPGNADAHVNLGNLFDDLKRPADAEREYRAAMALDPKGASAPYNLGLLLLVRDRPAEAEVLFRGLLEKTGHDEEIRRGLAQALEAQGKPGVATAAVNASRDRPLKSP